ncbi:MAG: L,D-transpeptidase [gamma proteobacterium symbiont of Taylorina sp.]|nr:L,D-transpeptidase [gamma proteobacterium symbiont of Taylorina sp.]
MNLSPLSLCRKKCLQSDNGKKFIGLGLLLILFFPLHIAAESAENVWLLVDTKKLELSVKLGNTTLMHFSNISIGRNGAGFKHKRGDDITPLGAYKISWINKKSRYHFFYGFNYPSIENVQIALNKGLVDKRVFNQIIKAHKQNQTPPQNTPLGGMIGIHGLGRADKTIHETMNWTHGCIALNNEQIIKLDKLIKKNTIVIVK